MKPSSGHRTDNLVCKWHLIPWHIRCVGRILPPKKTTLDPAQQGQFLRNLHNLGMEWMEWPHSNANLNFLNAWFISLAVLGEQHNKHNKHNHAGWLAKKLVEEWDATPQQCMTSMERRRQTVVAVHGSSELQRELFVKWIVKLPKFLNSSGLNHLTHQKKSQQNKPLDVEYFSLVRHSALQLIPQIHAPFQMEHNLKDTKSLSEAIRLITKQHWGQQRNHPTQISLFVVPSLSYLFTDLRRCTRRRTE